jgi:hypothetical protein
VVKELTSETQTLAGQAAKIVSLTYDSDSNRVINTVTSNTLAKSLILGGNISRALQGAGVVDSFVLSMNMIDDLSEVTSNFSSKTSIQDPRQDVKSSGLMEFSTWNEDMCSKRLLATLKNSVVDRSCHFRARE